MNLQMPIKKPPRFLPVSNSRGKGADRFFIYHSQAPRFLAEVLTDPSAEVLAEYSADEKTERMFSKRVNGKTYYAIAIQAEDKAIFQAEFGKLSSRLEDWFLSYILDSDSGEA